MTDREFWLVVRRALLMVANAIERRYGVDTVVAHVYADDITLRR